MWPAQLVRSLKNSVVPAGLRSRRILAGPFKGIAMNMDLTCQIQVLIGLSELEITPWFARLSQGISCAVDIGVANGEYALFMLCKTNAKKVFAIEPDAGMLQRFTVNLHLNGLSPSDRRLVILGKFIHSDAAPNHISPDELASGLEGPCLIKMDIDG